MSHFIRRAFLSSLSVERCAFIAQNEEEYKDIIEEQIYVIATRLTAKYWQIASQGVHFPHVTGQSL